MRVVPPEPILLTQSSGNLSNNGNSIDALARSTRSLTEPFKEIIATTRKDAIKKSPIEDEEVDRNQNSPNDRENVPAQRVATGSQPTERSSRFRVSLAASATSSIDEMLRQTGGRSENRDDHAKIKELCREFGVPDPKDFYVVPRDYAVPGKANNTQFSMKMPEGLQKWVEEDEFRYTVGRINHIFAEAEKVTCGSVMCGILNFIVCHACPSTKQKQAIKEVKDFIVEENNTIYHQKGLHIVDPALRGLRHIEIRSITLYSMKYFLEHEDEITVTPSDSSSSSAPRDSARIKK